MEESERELRKNVRKRFREEGSSSLTAMSPESYFKLRAGMLWSLDKVQVNMFNQIRAAIVNDIISKNSLYPEIKKFRREENIGTDDEIQVKKTGIAKLIKRCLSEELKLPEGDAEVLVTEKTSYEFNSSQEGLAYVIAEEELVKKLTPYIKSLPIYNRYLGKVRGAGIKTSAKLLSIVGDLRRFPTPSALWKYSGLAVDETGCAEKRKKGVQLHSNPKLKSLLLGVMAGNFVKQHSQYEVVYRKRDARTRITHPEWHHLNPDGTKDTEPNKHPMRGMRDAYRIMMKRFEVDLWMAGWQAYGEKPPCNPYILNDPKHHLDPPIVPYGESQIHCETQTMNA